MKRLLLSFVCLMALGGHSRAQLATFDATATLGISKGTIETVKNGLTELRSLQTGIQSLQQWVWMGQNMIHDPSLGAVMQLMQMTGLANDLPLNPYAVQSLLSGYGGMNSIGGLTGKLSTLGNLVNGSYNTDHLYNCHDQTFACVQSNQQAAANAGAKGIASTLYSDLTTHMNVLTGLRARLLTAGDPKTVQDATGQIEAEHTWVANTTAQLMAANMISETQARIGRQQQDEKISADFDGYLTASPK